MPGSTPGPIEELYAIVSDEGDREGIVGGIVPGIGTAPMITGSRKALTYYREFAQELARETGKKLYVVTFTRAREEPL